MPQYRWPISPKSATPTVLTGPGAEDSALRYLGYEQITSLSSAESLTPPDGTRFAWLQPEGGSVRMLFDEDPTGDVGWPVWATANFPLPGKFASARFIQMTGDTSILNIFYYGVAP